MILSVRSTCILASFLSKMESSAVKGAGSLVQNFKNEDNHKVTDILQI